MPKFSDKFGDPTFNNKLRDPVTSLLDGPSVSGLSPLTAACTIGVTATCDKTEAEISDQYKTVENITTTIPISPSSTVTTVPPLLTPNSSTESTTPVTISLPTEDIMPATTLSPTVIRSTTTAQIMDQNRFSILNKGALDLYNKSSPPKDNTSDKITVKNATASPTTPNSDKNANKDAGSPTKKKSNNKNHNNNHQGDVNSIESISSDTILPSSELDWIDELVSDSNKEILPKIKQKKKKKHSSSKELDQLDGVVSINKSTSASEATNKTIDSDLINKSNISDESSIEEDDKIVKCLYYTIMCCECTIS